MITFRREKYWRIELLATGKQKTDDSLFDYYPIDISSYGYEMLLEHQYAKCQRIAERITRNFFRKNPDYEPICLSESEYDRKIIDEMKEYAHQMMS